MTYVKKNCQYSPAGGDAWTNSKHSGMPTYKCLIYWIVIWIYGYDCLQTYSKLISMAQCITAVTPLLTHWGYCSLVMRHRYGIHWYANVILNHCWTYHPYALMLEQCKPYAICNWLLAYEFLYNIFYGHVNAFQSIFSFHQRINYLQLFLNITYECIIKFSVTCATSKYILSIYWTRGVLHV